MKIAFVLIGVTASLIPNVAAAQELDWSGAYVGVTAGVTDQSTQNIDNWCWAACDAPLIQDVHPSIGATVGANLQTKNGILVGVEADISTGGEKSINTPNSSNASPPPVFTWSSDFKWNSTVRARVGVVTSKSVIYMTGGYALARAEFSEDTQNFPPFGGHPGPFGASWSGTLHGYVYGFGIEHGSGKMSFKAEFLRANYMTKSACYADTVGPQTGQCITTFAPQPPILTWAPTTTTIRLGVNYRF